MADSPTNHILQNNYCFFHQHILSLCIFMKTFTTQKNKAVILKKSKMGQQVTILKKYLNFLEKHTVMVNSGSFFRISFLLKLLKRN